MQALAPVLSRHGQLSLRPSDEATNVDPAREARISQAFATGSGHGLLCLGADEVGTSLPPMLAYWRELGFGWRGRKRNRVPGRWLSWRALATF